MNGGFWIFLCLYLLFATLDAPHSSPPAPMGKTEQRIENTLQGIGLVLFGLAAVIVTPLGVVYGYYMVWIAFTIK